MPRLTRITETKRGRYALFLDDAFAFSLDEDTFAAAGLHAGDELTEPAVAELRRKSDARRALDWEAQFACAIDPERARAIRDDRLPEDDHSDTCSMCGKFCAVRSMNKALAGEHIDIL